MQATPKAAPIRATERFAKDRPEFSALLGLTRARLSQAVKQHTPIKQASSLGAEDVVITHLLQSLSLPATVFVLDTGALHQQTLALLERTQAALASHKSVSVEVFHPRLESVIEFIQDKGQLGIYDSIDNRKACCHIRKLEPLSRALAAQKAWITGLRREQSNTRSLVPLVDESELESKGWVKVNPLMDWSWGDVWQYIKTYKVDYNPLHDEFYPSIGCAPCTRAISMGEDFRSGRWWWEDENAKECGLHVSTALAPSP
jgi:phosphoadenosine phosphosulfate reductase